MLTYVSPDLKLGITKEMTKNPMCHGNVNLNDTNTKKMPRQYLWSTKMQC
jgi:hypothetical protein